MYIDVNVSTYVDVYRHVFVHIFLRVYGHVHLDRTRDMFLSKQLTHVCIYIWGGHGQ